MSEVSGLIASAMKMISGMRAPRSSASSSVNEIARPEGSPA